MTGNAPLDARWRIALLALFGAILFLLYFPGLNGPFVFDSVPGISQSARVRLDSLRVDEILKALKGPRPIGTLSFALNYYAFGADPLSYRIINVVIHYLCGVFLYFFIVQLLRSPAVDADDRRASLVPIGSTLLWLVHPVNTQSVTYAVQRYNSLASLFFVFSLWAYARGRISRTSRRWFAAAIFSGLLAVGSKENAVVLPFFIFLYEWFFLQDLNKGWLRNRLKWAAVPVVVAAVVSFAYLGTEPLKLLSSLRDFSENEFTYGQRVLTQPRVVMTYVSLFFFPHPSRLNLDYDFPLSDSLIQPITTLLSILVIIVFLAAAIACARRQRLVSFCVLWFFGNLAIESSFIPLALIFEHRTYLPYMLLSLLFVDQLYFLAKRPLVFSALVVSVAAVFSVWTFQRNQVWADPVSLWTDVVQKSPDKTRPHVNLGTVVEERDGKEAAAKHYEKALQLDPKQVEALNNLGRVLYVRGELKESMALFDRALAVNPDYVRALNNKGATHILLGEPQKAIAVLSRALELEPDNAKVEENMGNALQQLGNMGAAMSHFQRAIELNPGMVESRVNLAAILMQQGKLDAARFHLEKALASNPDNAEAHNNMGTLLVQTGRLEQAETQFDEAIRNDPTLEAARDNLVRLLSMIQDPVAKADQLKEHIRQHPGDPVQYWKLGLLFAGAGHMPQAEEMFDKAIAADERFLPALNDAASLDAIAGRHEKALARLEAIVEIDPARADAYYNAACMHARMGNGREAIEWLKQAIEKGYRRWDRIETDPDFDSIRETEAFKALMRQRQP